MNLDAIIDRLALALARANGYRPGRRRKKSVHTPPRSWPAQFRSHREWQDWCAMDEMSEAAEMVNLPRAA